MIDYNPLSPPPLVTISPQFFFHRYMAPYISKCDTLTIDWSLRGIVLRWHMILWREFMLRNMFPVMYFWSWFGSCDFLAVAVLKIQNFASKFVIKVMRFCGFCYNERASQFIEIDSTAQSSSSFSSTRQFHCNWGFNSNCDQCLWIRRFLRLLHSSTTLCVCLCTTPRTRTT